MPAYCGYAWVPIAGMPGHRLRPLFHEIVGWNAMDLMREFLQKSRRGIDKSRVTCGTKRKFAEVNASLVLNFGI